MEPENIPVRGHGHGFHQIKGSYTAPLSKSKEGVESAIVRDLYVKEQSPHLAKHVQQMKKVCAEILFKKGGIVPDASAGVADPNANAVINNVDAKIFHPTRGGTSVQFLNEGEGNKKINDFCKNVQITLMQNFGTTTTETFKENPNSFPSTEFIPIVNVHMTALAMGVVDAKDEESFNKQLENNTAYRAVYKFFDQNKNIDTIAIGMPGQTKEVNKDDLLKLIASHPDPIKLINEEFPEAVLEIMLSEKPETSPKLESFIEGGGAVFNAIDIKITNNGSLVIQLAPNNDLIHVKEGLIEVGGIAKAGLGNMAGITVGFFPNFDKTSPKDRENLEAILKGLDTELLKMNCTVTMESLNFVAFKVNSLLPTHIEITPITNHTKLGDLNFQYLP